jgi:tetratricopeptide (TPR) repeat protein
MNLQALKAATLFVEAPGTRGTAYLIAPKLLATCHHVVENAGLGGPVTLTTITGAQAQAKVTQLVENTDCAILELDAPLTGVSPLPLASDCNARALWDGFGFPGIAAHGGVPFFGQVLDPQSTDDIGRPMVTLYSDMVAAGMGSPMNGLSGGPVLVDGLVVGHFSRVIGVPGAPGQPALGVVYASRSANVLALAGLSAAAGTPEMPEARSLKTDIPSIGKNELHVFISYRSVDRPFALRLYERMDALGLRVFLDQNELLPGDHLAGTLHEALGRSRAAVILLSKSYLESPWCQAECERLVHLSITKPGFRLIPLRLDDAPLPGKLSTLLSVDFSGEKLPGGDKLNSVVYAVIGQQPPAEGTANAKLRAVEVAATDEALQAVDKMVDAKIRDPRRLRGVVDYLRSVGLPASATRLRVGQSLIAAGWLASALEVLPPVEDSLRSRQLRALALSKMGDDQQALDLLEPLISLSGEVDAETAGILGGVYKRMWLASNGPLKLAQSLAAYQVGYTRTGDVYVGINVATLALLSGDRLKAERIAKEVLAKLGALEGSKLHYWDRATLGEAYAVLGKRDQSLSWYRQAAVGAATSPQDIAVMRRQARLVFNHHGWDVADLVAALPTPAVVAFSGHMTDLPGRAVPRFPPDKVEAVRREICKWLKARKAEIHGVSSAARGGDLLFLGEVLAINGTATVHLPFPKADFIETSIRDPKWQAKLETALANDRVHCATPLLEKAPPAGPEQDAAFERCNEVLAQEAERLANLFDDPEPTLLTLWNGTPGDGSGGTAHAVETWKQRGYPHQNIDLSEL